ncbi:MAG: isochorismate synthase [Opitutaceae bacterium]|nr:isochorismate synthase [Opitutaceae bacterium]MBP9913191.1 isochorismate synthase [Opitutaceae bacterium]
MTILPLDPAANASPDALGAFLAQCRVAAIAAGHPKLVSITLAVEALDPLAVLESIFEPDEPHFYAERPDIGSAIAGAETATAFEAHGPQRFAAVQRWMDDILEHTIAVGEVSAPFGGPHFFAGFTFADEVETGEPFPAAQVFVPRWQVARAGSMTTAVANLLVTPDADLAALTERVWRAHEKFRGFTYHAPASTEMAAPPHFSVQESGDYHAAVTTALQQIAAGKFSKIVLARALDLTASQPLHPLRVLNGLRQRFPDCYAFSIANGRRQSFIGASPERLVRVSKGVLETEALAGTTRRGGGASEDAALAAALLHAEKDLREHHHVVEAVTTRLSELGLAPQCSAQPGLRRLANLQHLHTPIQATLGGEVRLLDVLARLHPTPAVGGTPQTAAVSHIRGLEGFPRGLYAGSIGWLNSRGGGEFFVGLRSALIEEGNARVYAGAGIVAGSTPEKEFAETELKFKAMLDALLTP